MTYFRRPLGDGPVTSPHDVDPSLPPFDPSGESTVGVVTPGRRPTCDELPADSPWRQPGQACHERNLVVAALDYLRGLIPNQMAPQTIPSQPNSVIPTLIVLGGAGVGAYYLLRKTKNKRS